MKKDYKFYSEFAENHKMPEMVSIEEIEEKMEQQAREEESDNIVLAEDRRAAD